MAADNGAEWLAERLRAAGVAAGPETRATTEQPGLRGRLGLRGCGGDAPTSAGRWKLQHGGEELGSEIVGRRGIRVVDEASPSLASSASRTMMAAKRKPEKIS